jgi:hypothetical protein
MGHVRIETMQTVVAGGAATDKIDLVEFSQRVRIPLPALVAAINAHRFTRQDGLVLGEDGVFVDFGIWRERYPVKRARRKR